MEAQNGQGKSFNLGTPSTALRVFAGTVISCLSFSQALDIPVPGHVPPENGKCPLPMKRTNPRRTLYVLVPTVITGNDNATGPGESAGLNYFGMQRHETAWRGSVQRRPVLDPPGCIR